MDNIISRISEFSQQIHWIDILLVCFLLIGVKIGYSRGGNGMLPKSLKWMTALVAASSLYAVLGTLMVNLLNMNVTLAYVSSYALIVAVVLISFLFLEDNMEKRIKDSRVFSEIDEMGGAMMGLLNHAMILVVFFALMHGNRTGKTQGLIGMAQVKEEYGDAGFFTLYQAKVTLFSDSNFGKLVEAKFGSLLVSDEIEPVAAKEKNDE